MMQLQVVAAALKSSLGHIDSIEKSPFRKAGRLIFKHAVAQGGNTFILASILFACFVAWLFGL